MIRRKESLRLFLVLLLAVLSLRLEIGNLGDYFFFSKVKSDEKSRRCQEQGNQRFANVLHLKLLVHCYPNPPKSQLFRHLNVNLSIPGGNMPFEWVARLDGMPGCSLSRFRQKSNPPSTMFLR